MESFKEERQVAIVGTEGERGVFSKGFQVRISIYCSFLILAPTFSCPWLILPFSLSISFHANLTHPLPFQVLNPIR